MAMLLAILNNLDFYNLSANPFSGGNKRATSYTWKTLYAVVCLLRTKIKKIGSNFFDLLMKLINFLLIVLLF